MNVASICKPEVKTAIALFMALQAERGEIKQALEGYLAGLARYQANQATVAWTTVEIGKVEIADAILNALELPSKSGQVLGKPVIGSLEQLLGVTISSGRSI